MNERVKNLWLKALRSGEYEQTDGYLRNGNEFCCLGVLCDVAIKDGLNLEVKRGEEVSYYTYGNSHYTSSFAALPQEVMEWAGLPGESDPSVKVLNEDGDEYEETLSVLNDSLGYSFTDIADVIEEQL